MVVLKKFRDGKSPHGMTHGEIHKNNKHGKRAYKPCDKLFCDVVLDFLFFLLFLTGHRRSVSRFFHRRDNRGGVGRALNIHRIGEQIDGTGGNSRHLRNRLFHP